MRPSTEESLQGQKYSKKQSNITIPNDFQWEPDTKLLVSTLNFSRYVLTMTKAHEIETLMRNPLLCRKKNMERRKCKIKGVQEQEHGLQDIVFSQYSLSRDEYTPWNAKMQLQDRVPCNTQHRGQWLKRTSVPFPASFLCPIGCLSIPQHDIQRVFYSHGLVRTPGQVLYYWHIPMKLLLFYFFCFHLQHYSVGKVLFVFSVRKSVYDEGETQNRGCFMLQAV